MKKSENTDGKMIEVYEKYAPKNISLSTFIEMVKDDPALLDDIGGKFSTVDTTIKKAYKEVRRGRKSKKEFNELLGSKMDEKAVAQVVNNYVRVYADIICSDDDILQAAWCFETLTELERQELAEKIIKAINAHFGIEEKLSVVYWERHSRRPFDDKYTELCDRIVSLLRGRKYKRHAGLYGDGMIVMSKRTEFADFINILSHEYGHFIDDKFPELGMLGAQAAFYAYKVYDHFDNYMTNPTEVSSYKIGETVKERITSILKEQAKKKPALYAKALKKAIGCVKTKLAAMDLKYGKDLKSAEWAEDEFYQTKTIVMHELFPDYTEIDLDRHTGIMAAVMEDPRVKRAKRRWDRLMADIPDEYNDLQYLLETYESDLAECESQLAQAKSKTSHDR